MTGCILLPDCFTKTVTDAFFENLTGALSRKLVIERQDTVYSQCIIFYVKEREFDGQMIEVRREFASELRKMLNMPFRDDNFVEVDSLEFGDLRRRPKFSDETM